MPKQVATLNDFSGGLNNATDARDLAPNEFVECINLDPHKKGKLITSLKFKDISADNGAVVDGYGMFVFSNDYKISDDTDGYTGYYIAQADGSGNIDIYQSGNTTWYDNELAYAGVTPAFMSAEGDLFVSGDIGGGAPTPVSLVFIQRRDFNLSTGSASAIGRPVREWTASNQSKPAPAAANMQMWWSSISGGTNNINVNTMTGASEDAIADDEIIWVIEWDHSVDGSTGSWSQIGDVSAGRHIQFAATWLYKNQAESAMYELTTPDYAGAALDDGINASDRAIKVHACIKSVTEKARYGARLYSRMSDEKEWYLLAEVDYEKGIIGDAETEFTAWINGGFSAVISASTGFIEHPPAIYSFFAINGYSPSDIPKINTSADRKVYWKVGVIANSRAYIGNVKINDRVYGDRIFKSPPYQYDVFTENLWIETTTNDGDEITAMATFADRILMFKEDSVTVINVSQVEEYVEAEQKEAGVTWPAAVAHTQFGIAWVNQTGCFMYNGETISNLLYTKSEGGQTQKIDDVTWYGDILYNPIVGFTPKTRQLIVIGNAARPNNAYIYSFDTQSWSEVSDLLSDVADASNMVNVEGGDLYIQGGAAGDKINKLTTRADEAGTVPTVTLETGELSFGNYESKKNLNKIVITYQGGASTSIAVTGSTNGDAYGGATLGTLSGAAGRRTETINLTGDADYQGKKTFQFKLTGTAAYAFELEDISFIFRDLGTR